MAKTFSKYFQTKKENFILERKYNGVKKNVYIFGTSKVGGLLYGMIAMFKGSVRENLKRV